MRLKLPPWIQSLTPGGAADTEAVQEDDDRLGARDLADVAVGDRVPADVEGAFALDRLRVERHVFRVDLGAALDVTGIEIARAVVLDQEEVAVILRVEDVGVLEQLVLVRRQLVRLRRRRFRSGRRRRDDQKQATSTCLIAADARRGEQPVNSASPPPRRR